MPSDSEDNLIFLEDHRILSENEFNDEQVAYLEALWGKKTFAFNVAVRDLEAMRQGSSDKSLRIPETNHEMVHMILHVRALANDLARHFKLDHMIRVDDDLPGRDSGPGSGNKK